MAPTATTPITDRAEAARLTVALLRFVSAAAHPALGTPNPGQPRIGVDAYVFSPSWVTTPLAEVEQFLVALPGPAMLSSTLSRGIFNLVLVDELTGERRRWAEKTLSNLVANLDVMSSQLGLTESSSVLLEFDEESHLFSLSTIYTWATQMAVEVGFNLRALENEPKAEACLMLISPDRRRFPGRSNILRDLRTRE